MLTSSHKFASLLLGLLLILQVPTAASVVVKPNHPERYTVVKGDTLWDIAARFLRDPWHWPDVWHVNPQINNPHLIFPGDVITLTYIDGQPRLGLERGVVKLSPQIHTTPLDGAISVIPIDAIHPFLTRPFVLGKGELENAPYVVAFDDGHIVGSTDIKAYVRTIDTEDNLKFDVVRPGGVYRDADTGEILGYEAIFVGNGQLQRTGDPATLMLTDVELETIIGDRVLPVADEVPLVAFYPKAPEQDVNGSIISVLGGVSQIGQYNVVVLDRGADDGLAPGDVLAIDHRGQTIRDVVSKKFLAKVTLPDEPAGTLMVFRTFPRVSFGLVMTAYRTIHLKDRVHNPRRQ